RDTAAERGLMLAYLLRRLLLVVPTLFGIMVLNFFIVQTAPGGPVEQMIAQIQGTAVGATERFSGSSSGGELIQRPQGSLPGGTYAKWFPLRGLVSDDWQSFSLAHKVADYLWHMVLPIGAMVIGGFAGLAFLTKNSFIEEIGKQYVLTARAKGLVEARVLYGH